MNLLTGGERFAFYESCHQSASYQSKVSTSGWTTRSPENPVLSLLHFGCDAWLWCQSFYLCYDILGVSGTNFSAAFSVFVFP